MKKGLYVLIALISLGQNVCGAEAQDTLTNLQAQLDSDKARLKNLDIQAADLPKQIAALQAKLVEVKGQKDTLSRDIPSEIQQIEKLKFENFKSQLDGLVKKFESDVQKLKSQKLDNGGFYTSFKETLMKLQQKASDAYEKNSKRLEDILAGIQKVVIFSPSVVQSNQNQKDGGVVQVESYREASVQELDPIFKDLTSVVVSA